MKHSILSFILFFNVLSLFSQNIHLPAPDKTGGKPLMEALNLRQSNREFSGKEIPQQTLSNLLWAAYGFNRADKRVVPSSQNKQEIDVYVAINSGIYFYDAKANQLVMKIPGDHRKSTGKQDYIFPAPLHFIIVANVNKASDRESCFIDAGFICQNIYLFCASQNMNSVVRGYFDKESLHSLMKLDNNQEIIITQTVGYKTD